MRLYYLYHFYYITYRIISTACRTKYKPAWPFHIAGTILEPSRRAGPAWPICAPSSTAVAACNLPREQQQHPAHQQQQRNERPPVFASPWFVSLFVRSLPKDGFPNEYENFFCRRKSGTIRMDFNAIRCGLTVEGRIQQFQTRKRHKTG